MVRARPNEEARNKALGINKSEMMKILTKI
jgi:hypothetical protein